MMLVHVGWTGRLRSHKTALAFPLIEPPVSTKTLAPIAETNDAATVGIINSTNQHEEKMMKQLTTAFDAPAVDNQNIATAGKRGRAATPLREHSKSIVSRIVAPQSSWLGLTSPILVDGRTTISYSNARVPIGECKISNLCL